MTRNTLLKSLAVAACAIAAPATAQIQRWKLATLTPANDGGLTAYRFFAAEEWRKTPLLPNGQIDYSGTTDLPDAAIDPKSPLLVDYEDGSPPRVLFYSEGRFRTANGGIQAAPKRWALIALAESTWDGQKFVRPGVGVRTPVKLPLAYTVARLMSENPKKAIMDEMDKYPGLDGTGAPE